jgi:hypothetical protein
MVKRLKIFSSEDFHTDIVRRRPGIGKALGNSPECCRRELKEIVYSVNTLVNTLADISSALSHMDTGI